MINTGMTNYGGYLGLIGDIMGAKSAGGADELNAQLQIRKGIKNARRSRLIISEPTLPALLLFSKIPLIIRTLPS
jgi:hypothetical protein